MIKYLILYLITLVYVNQIKLVFFKINKFNKKNKNFDCMKIINMRE